MNHQHATGPTIDIEATLIPNPNLNMPGEVRSQLRLSAPVPVESLYLLFETACGPTTVSQAARSFLFWLIGQEDPNGSRSLGGIELRRLDCRCRQAALQVLAWWTSGTQNDQPLYDVLERLGRYLPW
jgi:hypothetical protein